MNIIDTIEELERYNQEPPKPLAEMTFRERVNYELEAKGWIALKFDTWVRDTIILAADDQVTGIPGGYAVYTLTEFEMAIEDENPYLVHYAKKHYGAVIMSIEIRRNRW